MKTGDVVWVKPETITWNPTNRTLEGKVKGQKVVVPTCQLALQDLRWDKTDFPKEIEEAVAEGFSAIVRKVEDDQITVSRREFQERNFKELKEGEIYQGRILFVTPYSVFVKVRGLRVRVYITDCTRARMTDLRDYYKPGEKMKVKILEKEQEFPYRIAGSRKDAYPNIEQTEKQYSRGDYIYVRVCERLNDDGYRVEVTPNIPGILNGEKEQLDRLIRGKKIKAKIIDVSKLGIKCRVVESNGYN